jgi:signal transduction histidine kinase/ligand-binding sensor domain-containing protein
VNRRFYLFFVILLSFRPVFSQIIDQKVYHLTKNNGLSQSTVNSMVKDSAGYMWFGTNDGLNKYDGYRFTIYRYNPQDVKSIGLGRIRVLFIDSKGGMWIGTDQSGLYLYRASHDNFDKLQRLEYNGSQVSINDIRDILETGDGRLWIATYGNGLILYNPSSGQIKVIDNEFITNINCIEYLRNDLYIGSQNGVYVLNGAGNNPDGSNEPQAIKLLPDIEIFCLYGSRDGLLWVGTYGKGAFSLDSQTLNVTAYSTQQPYPRKLDHDIVRDIIDDSHNGSLLIGTGGGGINVLNGKRDNIEYVRSKLNDQFSLNTNIIYSFYRDNIDNLWIGTYNGGVNVLFRTKDKFGHIKSFGGANELSNNSVLSIVEANDGKLWIGTDGGGLELFNPVTKEFKHYRHDPANNNSLAGDVVKSLLLDKEGILWVGSFNAGLTAFDLKKNTFYRFPYVPNNPNGISQNHIWDIAEDNEGNIWLATLGGGLDRYSKKEGKFRHFRHDPSEPAGISDNVLSCMLYDSKGNLWVGTEFGGVNRMLDENKGIFKIYNRFAKKELISSNQISTIFEDSHQNVWVGTIGGGLNLYLEKEDRFMKYTEADGLANNLIYAILEDNEGNLWITTNNGLSEFVNAVNRPAKAEFKNYNIGDGLQSNEFSARSACKTTNGILYFGGINGINYFNPESITFNTHIPPVVLTDFKIFNKSVTIDEPGSPLKKPVFLTDEIELSFRQSVITFEFAALDFTMPSKNRYKYKLEGFENNWNDVGNQRTATYTNLNPGHYTFRVIGSNNDDVWNYQGASVVLKIDPPFWKTWLFRIAVVCIFIVAIFIFYRLKLHSLENHRRELKSMVDERTVELLELNRVLEKQNKEIQFHREELLTQKENLIKTNYELEKNQKKIEEQNDELALHRLNLEELVKQRTSELEKAKQKAEESDRLKSSFLSNMSHEIRTPLNAIVGFSSLIAEGDTTEEEREEFIKQINANTETLLVLIDDILDLSKIESNQIKIMNSEIPLTEFLDDIYNSFPYRHEKKLSFLLTNPYKDNDLRFVSDRTRLRQIVVNLLDNSFKFTEKGHVELGVYKENDHLVFYVEDTGIGMSDSVRQKIFERFYKSDENAERVYRGTGLGLTITQKLTDLLGGSISVKSEEGKGSRFEIDIPLIIAQ